MLNPWWLFRAGVLPLMGAEVVTESPPVALVAVPCSSPPSWNDTVRPSWWVAGCLWGLHPRVLHKDMPGVHHGCFVRQWTQGRGGWRDSNWLPAAGPCGWRVCKMLRALAWRTRPLQEDSQSGPMPEETGSVVNVCQPLLLQLNDCFLWQSGLGMGFALFLFFWWFTYHKIHPFKLCNLVGFFFFTKLWNYHYCLIPAIPKEFSSPPKETSSLLAVTFYSFLSPASVVHESTFCLDQSVQPRQFI